MAFGTSSTPTSPTSPTSTSGGFFSDWRKKLAAVQPGVAPIDPNAPIADGTTMPVGDHPTDQAQWTQPWSDAVDHDEFTLPQYTSSNYGTAPGGYDPVKWTSADHQTPKYVVGRITADGFASGKPLDQIVADIQRAYPGTTWNGKDIITNPEWGSIDFVRDIGGPNQGVAWQVEGDGGTVDQAAAGGGAAPANSWTDPTSGGGAGTYGGGAAGAGGATGTGLSTSTYSTDPALEAATREAILNKLNTPEVNAESLRNSPQFQAVQLAGQRAEERQRAQMAERASKDGWNDSGGFEGEINGLQQARGEFEASELGNLAQSEVEARRAEISQGIQFAMASGQFDKAQMLQKELANLDASLRREGMSQQNSQFFSDLNERARQSNNNLGFNYTDLQARMNRDAVIAGLG